MELWQYDATDLARLIRTGQASAREAVDSVLKRLHAVNPTINAVVRVLEQEARAEAETANVRTRAKRDVDDARQYATQKFARDVAEAAENLRRGLDAIPPVASDEIALVGRLRDGFTGVERSFLDLLDRNGVKREDPTGAMFDPNLHQAMAEQETADHPAGTVIQAWTQAWTLNGRLLRPAMVVVAKAPAAAIEPPAVDTTA